MNLELTEDERAALLVVLPGCILHTRRVLYQCEQINEPTEEEQLAYENHLSVHARLVAILEKLNKLPA